MTITQNFAAKAAVAFVAIAMALTLVAPSAKAQDISGMTLEQLIALVNQLQGQLSGSAATGSCSFTFTRSLGTGSTGADVMNLQKFLNSSADTQVAAAGAAGSTGMETSFYGPATAAAVSKFQTKYSASILVPAGLTMPTGYFGPSSMAKANALCAASTGTGTGTGTTTGELKGGAGSINVSTLTTGVEDEVSTGDSENVLGFKLEADSSDVEVTNLKLTLTYTGNTSNRLDRYFDSFDIVMEGDVVASIDASDIDRDSSGVYSANVSLKDAIIRENDKNEFYVVGHAVSVIDSADAVSTSDWTVKASDFRYVDGDGAIISDSGSKSNTGVYVVKLASSGTVKARVSLSSSNPSTASVQVSDTASGDLVTLLEFKVKAEGTDMSFDTVRFNVATTGDLLSDMVSEFRLMDGSSVVDTVDVSDVTATTSSQGIITFSLDDMETISKDDSVTYKLVARMNKNTSGTLFTGSSITASIPDADSYYLNVEDENGDTVSDISGSAVGNAQTFRGDGLFADAQSTAANLLSINVSNTSRQYGEFKFVMDVTAGGDDFYFASTSGPTSGAIDYDILLNNAVNAAANASSSASISSNATLTSGGDYVIYSGETKQVTFTVTMGIGGSGVYRAIANSFDFGNSALDVFNETAVNLTPVSEFTTGTVTVQQ